MNGILRLAETIAVGVASGMLSGMFGIGGGVVTTPAIRLLLGAPALIAVGTPLVAIIPSAVTGAVSYVRSGMADLRGGVLIGLAGFLPAIAGAWATKLAGGAVVLTVTAVVILVTAADMWLRVLRPAGPDGGDPASGPPAHASALALLGVGIVTGLYSGFLGLGGGFILVPLLARALRFQMKRAIGTSLVAITILALPAMIAHGLLGNIDWSIAAGLVVGVVPGAMLGAHVTLGARDRSVHIGFALLLAAVALWLGLSELAGWGV